MSARERETDAYHIAFVKMATANGLSASAALRIAIDEGRDLAAWEFWQTARRYERNRLKKPKASA